MLEVVSQSVEHDDVLLGNTPLARYNRLFPPLTLVNYF